MDPQQLKEIFQAVKLELVRYKEWCVGIFIVVSLGVLALGSIWPQTYRTSAQLYADESNIIKPLLSGKAEVTQVERAQVAKEVIYTRAFMRSVVLDAKLADEGSPEEIERKIGYLRTAVKLASVDKNHFTITFNHPNPDKSFSILSSTVKNFIEYTSRRKKEESYSAYQFIDAQVQAYKAELEAAEQKLKEFKAKNIEGTEASVSGRIAQLRSEIETLKLSIEESKSKISSVTTQLSEESSYLQTRSKLNAIEQRKASLVSELENLRLTYQENYPDVVTMKSQIAELDKRIEEIYTLEGLTTNSGTSASSAQNPLFEELRKQLAVAEVDLKAQQQRMKSLQRLLQEEYLRKEKIAENEAELAELLRDYSVIQNTYNEMLDSKEKARVSMALDVEGQGVTYRIHEPPVFPLNSVGLKFHHFAFLGPILGMLIPIGLVVALIMLDPRIRASSKLSASLEDVVELIGTVPHSSTAIAKRIVRRDALIVLGVIVGFFAIYVGIVANQLMQSV